VAPNRLRNHSEQTEWLTHSLGYLRSQDVEKELCERITTPTLTPRPPSPVRPKDQTKNHKLSECRSFRTRRVRTTKKQS
jgi:hypothetical protein